MKTPSDSVPFEELLAHADWVSRLAHGLVRDAARAEDVVQETWLAALRRPPARGSSPRAWLATVVRRAAGEGGRRDRARAAREAEAARPEALSSAAELAERAGRQRDVVDAVLELDDVHRDALLLRWFEGLPPRAIAARLDVPVATVTTRLQRGHARLRARLESKYGDGRGWVLGLAPLLRDPTLRLANTAALVTSNLPLTLGLVTGAAAATLATWLLFAGARDEAEPREVELAVASEQAPAPRELAAFEARSASAPAAERVPVERPDPPSAARADRSAPPAASAPVPAPARVRAVDPTGRALEGFRLRQPGPHAVTWQGGDPVWVGNDIDTLRISLADQERLRADREYGEELCAAQLFPEEWRATLLGEPLPEREFATGADGLVPPRLARSVVAADRGWCVLYRALERGSEDVILVVTPAAQLAGRIVDAAREPVDGATVSFVRDPAEVPVLRGIEPFRAYLPREIRSDSTGRFVLRDVPAYPGARWAVEAPGFARRELPVPGGGDRELVVELEPLLAAPRVVAGTVLDGGGAPLDAAVHVGRTSARTDDEGSFRLELNEVDPQARLIVVAPAKLPFVRERFGAELSGDADGFRDEQIVLADASLTLEGTIVDDARRPLDGLQVALFDATHFARGFTTLEARAGGRELSVPVAADGTFALSGLTDRDYRLRLFDAARGFVHVTEPIAASSAHARIRIPADATHARVRGRVVDREGHPLGNAGVAVSFETFRHPGGGSMTETGPITRCDADGRFELRDVPRAHAILYYGREDLEVTSIPVDWLLDPGDVELVHLPDARLQVELTDDRYDTLTLLDAAGQPVPVTTRERERSTAPVARGAQGFPECRADATAALLVLRGSGVSARSVSLELEPGRRTVVRP